MRSSTRVGVLSLRGVAAAWASSPATKRLLAGGPAVQRSRLQGALSCGTLVAVKIIPTTMNNLDDKSFKDEVACLIRAKHGNIVRLLGFCTHTTEEPAEFEGEIVQAEKRARLICFEYVPGSLDSYIKADGFPRLEWHQCYRIIMGICQGLCYLHGQNIVHLDLKPQNILLDQDMVPKISDFGLSRIFGAEQTRTVTSHNRGTLGYMAPEYINSGVISQKVDIYSLGIVLLQVITGTMNIPDTDDVLQIWRYKLEDSQLKQVEICFEIATECTKYNPKDRPTTDGIIERLGKTESMDGCTESLSCSTVLQGEMSSMESRGEPSSQIITMSGYSHIFSMDVHPTKPWIITSHYKSHFCIWDYMRKEMVRKITPQQMDMSSLTAKFIKREKWIMAGDYDGHIHVYNDDDAMKQVKTWEPHHAAITSLAIHPNKTYVLLASYNHNIELWDWQIPTHVWTFKGHTGSVYQIAFNPVDHKTFASVHQDKTIKIWNLDSLRPIPRQENSSRPIHTLIGHSLKVRCLDYFIQGEKQFLITGSDDTTAKVWDLQTNKCIETLEGHTDRVSAVCSHPMLAQLMTGSFDGDVRLWNSKTFRLEGVLNFGLKVHAFGCSMKDLRVMIGHSDGLVILKVDNEGHFVSTGNNEMAT